MRTLCLAIAFFCVTIPAASALTVCPISEFTINTPTRLDPTSATTEEIITAAVHRARACENPRITIRVDGQRRHGPLDAYAIRDSLVARGIPISDIRLDLLAPDSERWTEPLARGAIIVNTYHNQPPPDAAPSSMQCFDVALVARIERYDPGTMDWPDDQIVMRWPWTLTLEVERVIIGQESREEIDVTISLHTQWNSDIRHVLFFLQRDGDRYFVVDAETRVVRDRRGAFVAPFTRPPEAEEVWPRGWLPENHADHITPTHYRAQDAWWLRSNEAHATPGWSERRGRRVVALRGFPLDSLPQTLGRNPRALCRD